MLSGASFTSVLIAHYIKKKMKKKKSKVSIKEKKTAKEIRETLLPKAVKPIINKVEPVTRVEFKTFIKYDDKLIEQKDFEKKEFYFKADSKYYFTTRFWNLRHWKVRNFLDRRKAKKQPHNIVLVRMHLNNQRVREVLIPQTESFVYNGGKYIFDRKLGYFNLDVGMFCYDFYESCCLPLRKDIKFSDEIEKLVTLLHPKAGVPESPLQNLLLCSNHTLPFSACLRLVYSEYDHNLRSCDSRQGKLKQALPDRELLCLPNA